MRADLVMVSEPILHLFARICKCQEPVGVQTLRPESTVERLDVCIVRRLPWPGEVECYALCIGPEIKIAADKLDALVDTDGLGIADRFVDPFQCQHQVFTLVAEAWIDSWRGRMMTPAASWSAK